MKKKEDNNEIPILLVLLLVGLLIVCLSYIGNYTGYAVGGGEVSIGDSENVVDEPEQVVEEEIVEEEAEDQIEDTEIIEEVVEEEADKEVVEEQLVDEEIINVEEEPLQEESEGIAEDENFTIEEEVVQDEIYPEVLNQTEIIINKTEEIEEVVSEPEGGSNKGSNEQNLNNFINKTELNITTLENKTNITLLFNQTESNLSFFDNLTKLNITFLFNKTELNITTLENKTNITLLFNDVNKTIEEYVKGDIIINKPVWWNKRVKLEKVSSNFTVDLPKEAFNITVNNIRDNNKKDENISNNLLTGNAIGNTKIKSNILDFFRNLFRFTGFVVGQSVSLEKEIDESNLDIIDGGENKTLVIKEEAEEILIDYHTNGPISVEESITPYRKKILIDSGDLHFTNVSAYTFINDTQKESIKLYWLVNETRFEIEEVEYFDTNNNSLVDLLTWVVPSLSNQTYEVSINVLNIQSYPSVGSNWEVRFTTTGIADLRIKTINGTTWSNENENNDLRFLEVKCGSDTLDYGWINESVLVLGYECNETGYEISNVLTAGKHHLEFDFGGQRAYANNLATISDCQTLSDDNEYYLLDSDTTPNYDPNCFTVTGTNITLDCSGHVIDGNGDADGYGVIINGANYDQLTIKDCVIQQFARNVYVGAGSDDITIINSSFNEGYYDGMLVYSSDNMYIANSNFSGVNEYGIYVLTTGGDDNNANWTVINSTFKGGNTATDYGIDANYLYNGTFENNNFLGGGGASQCWGMRIDYADGSVFRNNLFEGGSTTNYDRALYISYGDSMVFENNVFLSHKTGYPATQIEYASNSFWNNNEFTHENNNYGLYYVYSKNVTIINSNINSTSSFGLRFHGVNNSLVENVTVSNFGASYGFYMANDNYNNVINYNDFSGRYAMYQAYSDNNTFYSNNFTSSVGAAGYTYIRYSDYNNYTNNNITSPTSYGAYFLTDNDYNYFENNLFTSNSQYGAYFNQWNDGNVFINNSFYSGANFGLRFTNNNDGTIMRHNNLTGVTWAFYYDNGNDNGVFEYNNFTTANSAVYVATRSSNNTFTGTNFISGTTADDDALYVATDSNDNVFTNSTFVGDRYGVNIYNSNGNLFENNNINSTGTSNADGDAIYMYLTPKDNVIRNNVIGALRFPIYMLYGVQYNNITGNILESRTADTRIYGSSDYNLFENNTIISGSANGAFGIYIYTSRGNIIKNNNITSGDYGLYLAYSSDNVIDNNNISVANIAGSYGIYLYIYSNNNNITNNSIVALGDNNIRIYASLYNYIENNIICDSGDYGIYIDEGSEENEIRQNKICDNALDGIYILSSNKNKIILNNISYNSDGISMINTQETKIEGNIISDNAAAGLNIGDSSTGSSTIKNGELIDTVISNSGTNDIILVASNLEAINLTYDSTKVSIDADSSAKFNWWVDANISDTITQVPNASVLVFDNTIALIDNKTTNSNGIAINFNLTEYYEDTNGRVYYSNYTFNASANNYFDNGITFNVTGNDIIDLILMESVPPVLQYILLSPNSDDDIDPNVQINTTSNVTDYIGVDTVILQYKESNNTEWMNSSTDYDARVLYTNGLFIPDTNNTWDYRIWANDSYNNQNYSSVFNVSVQYDYTWNRTPMSFGEVIGVLETTGPLGNLMINNTGDFNITIDLSSSWSDTTYNVTEPFVVQPKEIVIVGINVTFDNDITDVDSIISATASNNNQIPIPTQLNTTVTISSYTGGPYLRLTIDTYPALALQTSIQTVKARLQNLAKYEDETIYNITLNWTLPVGWAILDGTISFNVTNLTAQSNEWANLSLLVSTTAPYDINGTATIINVTGSSDSNTGDFDSINISLLCNGADGICGTGCWDEVDADCVNSAPIIIAAAGTGGTSISSGSTGGGGGGVSSTRALRLKESSETIEVLKGESTQFDFDVQNIYPDSVFKDVKLEIDGFLKQYIRIEPEIISEINYKEKQTFTIYIDVPSYLDFGNYQLDTMIIGSLVDNTGTQAITGKRTINLIVHEITSERAYEFLTLGEEALKQMKENGFITTLISRSLEDAKIAYENKQYTKTKNIVDQILNMKERAYDAKELMDEVEKRIINSEKQGLDVSATQRLFEMALAAFEREDYDAAIKNLKEAQLTELLETKGKLNILKFIYNYWWAIIIGTICLSLLGMFLYERIYLFIINYRIMYINKEEKNLIKLIKEAQNQYYNKKHIGFKKFSQTVDQYDKNLAKIRQKRLSLSSKKTLLLTTKTALYNLKKEKKKVLKEIESTQKRYFITRKITASKYNAEIKINHEKLSEIDKNIEMLNAKIDKESNRYLLKIKNKILNSLYFIIKFKLKKSKIDKEMKEINYRKIKQKIKKKIERDIERQLKKKKKKHKNKKNVKK